MATIQTLLRDGVSRRYSETVPTSGTSDAVLLDSHHDIAITVNPGAGGATIWFTNDDEDDIVNDLAAWEAWSFGSVSVITTKILAAAMAIKLVNDDGANTADLTVMVRT
jgi:hypothetical protein